MMGVLRYSADIRSLGFTVVTILLLIIPFIAAIPLLLSPIWILFASAFCFSCCAINHNHIHSPTFFRRRHNLAFNLLLTVARGHTATTIIVPHLLNHHRHNGHELDWIRPEIARKQGGFSRLLDYTVRASLNMRTKRKQPDAPQLNKHSRTNLLIERTLLYVFIILGLAVDWQVFLGFVVLPWLLAMAYLVAVNLLQHDGCDADSEHSHSRNFTNRLENWFLFNNGYHSIHHMKPGLHWTKLPEAHKELLVGRIDQNLDEGSILRYLWKQYIKPTFHPGICQKHETTP